MIHPIKVAIVDDHTIVREGLRNMLDDDRQERFDVIGVFGNGSDFLNYLKKYPCDVAIIDIQMPVKGGESTLEVLKQKYPNISSIVLSMNTRNYMIELMVKLGIYAYLPKEASVIEIKNAVDSAHKKKMVFNKLLTEQKYKQFISGKKTTFVLTLREQYVTSLIAQGLTSEEIAIKANISKSTVTKHRENINRKTQCKNQAELVNFAVQHNILELFPR
jgi:DNA-binding NarL/FixJ family response regulator